MEIDRNLLIKLTVYVNEYNKIITNKKRKIKKLYKNDYSLVC